MGVKNVGGDLDFEGASKILNAMMDPRTSDPSSPAAGQLWFNTTIGRLKTYNGSATLTIPTTTGNDTISGIYTFSPSSGQVPFLLASGATQKVANLNVDRVDDFHADQAGSGNTIAVRRSDGTLVASDPVNANELATKSYVDSTRQDADTKDECRVATTANIDLSSMPASIDGVTLTSGDRILVKNQTDASENGIYVFNGAASAATRSTDADENSEVTTGMTTYIVAGTDHQGGIFTLQTANPITVGTTDLSFTQTGGQSIFSAGNGIVKVASKFHFIQSTDYTPGSIVYANGANTMAFIAPDSSGKVLKSGSTPSWAALDLTADVGTSILGVSNGGTGTSTQFTQGSLIFAGASGVYTQDTSKLFWDNSNKRLGIGTNSPDGPLHILTGDSSVTAAAAADDLIVEGASAAGISILNATDGTGAIYFGKNGDADAASIVRDHSNSHTYFRHGTTDVLTFNGLGYVKVGNQIQSPVYYGTSNSPQNFLTFQDNQTLGNAMVTLGSINHLNFIIDTAAGGTDRKFQWWTGSTDVDSAALLMDLDEAGQMGIQGKLTVGGAAGGGSYQINALTTSGQSTVLVGSGDGGGSVMILDGNSNGDGAGGDYAFISHTSTGVLDFTNLQAKQISFTTSTGGGLAINSDKTVSVGRLLEAGCWPLDVFSSTNPGMLRLTCDAAGASGPLMRFQHDSASPAASDTIGDLEFVGKSSGGSSSETAHIRVVAREIGSTFVDSDVLFSVFNGGTESDVLSITHDGRIGVRKLAPDTILDIENGESGSTAPVKISATSTGDAAIRFNISGAQNWTLGIDNSDSDKFKINPNEALGSSPSFTIDTSGRSGFGTAAPDTSNILTVEGNSILRKADGTDLKFTVDNNSTGDSIVSVQRQASGNSSKVEFVDGGNVDWAIGTSGSSTFKILENGATTRFSISDGGNVAVGGISPAYTFSVNGSIGFGDGTYNRYALRHSRFGYGPAWRTLIIGSESTSYNTNTSGAVSICLGVDLSANTNSSFSGTGKEIFLRQDAQIKTPNAANDGFHTILNLAEGKTNFPGYVSFGAVDPLAPVHVVQSLEEDAFRIDGASSGYAMIVRGGTDYTTSIRAGLTIGSTYHSSTPPANSLIVEGLIGIGKVDPAYLIDAEIDSAGDSLIAKFNNVNAAGGSVVRVERTAGYRVAKIVFTTSDADDWHTGLVRNAGSVTSRYAITSTGDMNTAAPQFCIVGSNVGINTKDPSKTFHVNGALLVTAAGAALQLDSNAETDARFEFLYNGTREGLVSVNNNSLVMAGDTGTTVKVYTGAHTNQIVAGTSGAVGIGKSSPSAKLDILANISTAFASAAPDISNSIVSVANVTTTEAQNLQAQVQFTVNGGTYNRVGSFGMISSSATDRLSDFVWCLDNGTTRPEVMKLNSSGKLAIGENLSNIYRFQISGSSSVVNPNTNTAAMLWIANTNSADNSNAGILFGLKESGGNNYNVAAIIARRDNGSTTRTGDLEFYVSDQDDISDSDLRMLINNAGQVGIGTDSPEAKLTVSGADNAGSSIAIINTAVTNKWRIHAHYADQSLRFRPDDYTTDIFLLNDSGAGGISGKFGVGTLNPSANLEVQGGATSSDSILNLNDRITMTGDGQFKFGSNAAHGLLSWHTGEAIFSSIGSNNLVLKTGSSKRLIIDYTNGAVGIGPSAATYSLEVGASTTFSGTGTCKINASLNGSGVGLHINGNTRTGTEAAIHLLNVTDNGGNDALAVTVGGSVHLGALTASKCLFLDANKNIVTTGTSDLITEGSSNLYHTTARVHASITTASSYQISISGGTIGLGTEAGRVKSGTLGDAVATEHVFTHSLNTRAVNCTVYRTASPYDEIDVPIEHTSTTTVTVKPNKVWASGEFTIVVVAANG